MGRIAQSVEQLSLFIPCLRGPKSEGYRLQHDRLQVRVLLRSTKLQYQPHLQGAVVADSSVVEHQKHP